MPYQKRNEGCQGHNYEEWETGDSRRVSGMWNKDVQNRQELRLINNYVQSWIFVQDGCPAFLLLLHQMDICLMQARGFTLERPHMRLTFSMLSLATQQPRVPWGRLSPSCPCRQASIFPLASSRDRNRLWSGRLCLKRPSAPKPA